MLDLTDRFWLSLVEDCGNKIFFYLYTFIYDDKAKKWDTADIE